MNYAELAAQVGKALGRDNSKKQRIVQRSPHIFGAMDAGELEQASARELATRELKELGVEAGDNDPTALLDAHHAGREFERKRAGGGRPRWAQDSASGGDSFIDRYLKE